MPRIRCYYLDCKFLENGVCTSLSVQLDPDEGCLTYDTLDDDYLDDEDEEEMGWSTDEEDDEEGDSDFEDWDSSDDADPFLK